MLFTYILVWLISYIIYPAWHIPGNEAGRLVLSTGLLGWFVIGSFILRRNLTTLSDGHSPLKVEFPYYLIPVWIVFIALQIYPMAFLPITTGGDEHYHAYIAIPPIMAISDFLKDARLSFRIIAWGVTLLLFLSIIMAKRLTFANKFRRIFQVTSVFLLLIFVWKLTHSHFLDKAIYYEHIYRFPPFGKMASFLVYSFFGVGEYQSRIPSLIFCILTSFFIYRLVYLYRNKTVGYAASILFLFIPLVFYYARLAYLDMGGAFFMTLSFYYFLKFKKSGVSLGLYWSSLWGSVGFLYRRPVLMAVILIAFFYFLEVLKDKDKKRFYLGIKAYSISLFLILPWFILCNLFSTKYPYDLKNWLSLSKISHQFIKIPSHATLMVFLLFVVAVIYGLIKKRDYLTWSCLGLYGGWYVFIASTWAYFVDRYMVGTYVPISIIIAQFIDDNLRHPFIKCGIISFIGAYLAMNCILIPTQLVNSEYCVKTDSETGYLPYDEAFRYVAKNLPPGSKIVATMVCEPSHFYACLYGIDMNRIYRRNWVGDIEEDKGLFQQNWSSEGQNMDNLYQFCMKFGYDYVMFPRGGKWLLWSVDEQLVEVLAREEDNRFILIKKFKRGKNEIILLRVEKFQKGENAE